MLAAHDNDEPCNSGNAEPDERDRDDGARTSGTRGGEPTRTNAVIIRSPHSVGVVVGEVHTDLQRDRDHEAEQGAQPVPPSTVFFMRQHIGGSGAERHGSKSEGKRLDASAADPVARRCLGNLGRFRRAPTRTATLVLSGAGILVAVLARRRTRLRARLRRDGLRIDALLFGRGHGGILLKHD